MNRYLITKELFRGQNYIISALYDEKRNMLEVTPEPLEHTSILGNIYIGKVQNIVKNLNAAFIRIGPEQNCYLPLSDCKNPIFTNKISVKKNLAAGDELLVQVSKEALKTKEPVVSANLNFTGRYAVLTTGNRRLAVSSKLNGDLRRHYLDLLGTNRSVQDCGIIIRTNAAGIPDETVLQEINFLEQAYRRLTETAMHKTCYSILYREAAPWLKHLKDIHQEELEEILTDDPDIFEAVCENYQIPREALMTKGSVPIPVREIETENHIRIRYYEDDMLSLSSLYSVKSSLENALKEHIWLKSGAYLIIQPTEALTVIDVNTGKNTAKKDVQENFLKINKEAAVEIARQLRLRNLYGIILVDFMNLKEKQAEAELLSAFRRELKKDPVPTQLIDMTKLGLVEVTRKKVKKSLLEIFSQKP